MMATSLRKAKTTTQNDWNAICFIDGNFRHASSRENVEIFGRFGGGDSFASGLIF